MSGIEPITFRKYSWWESNPQQTRLKLAASSNWATGACFGWEGGNRTPKLRIQSAMALPICLLPISPPDWN